MSLFFYIIFLFQKSSTYKWV